MLDPSELLGSGDMGNFLSFPWTRIELVSEKKQAESRRIHGFATKLRRIAVHFPCGASDTANSIIVNIPTTQVAPKWAKNLLPTRICFPHSWAVPCGVGMNQNRSKQKEPGREPIFPEPEGARRERYSMPLGSGARGVLGRFGRFANWRRPLFLGGCHFGTQPPR